MRKFAVGFVLWYLRFFAKIQLKKMNAKIIGVGGSSGKTSLTLLISLILKEKYKVKQSGGKNSEVGLPLDILDIFVGNNSLYDWLRIIMLTMLRTFSSPKQYDYYIVEMGIDSPVEPKNMSYLLKIVTPDIAMVTNISLEHSQYFDDYVKEKDIDIREQEIIKLTAREESLLLRSLSKESMAIVNIDDYQIKQVLPDIAARKISISLQNKSADFYAKDIGIDLDKFLLEFIYDNKTYRILLHQPLPIHFAYEFLFALAVSTNLEIPLDSAISSIENNFSLPPGRLSIFEGIKDTTLIDSSYNNATLAPIIDILDLMQRFGGRRRKIGILGDMRELGSMSKLNHEAVAKKIINSLDLVILIGPLMQNYVAPILEKNNFPFFSFLTFTAAKEKILGSIKKEDIVLVKGSQNTLFLERAVEMLLADKKDISKLCRRGEFWDIKRSETP